MPRKRRLAQGAGGNPDSEDVLHPKKLIYQHTQDDTAQKQSSGRQKMGTLSFDVDIASKHGTHSFDLNLFALEQSDQQTQTPSQQITEIQAMMKKPYRIISTQSVKNEKQGS